MSCTVGMFHLRDFGDKIRSSRLPITSPIPIFLATTKTSTPLPLISGIATLYTTILSWVWRVDVSGWPRAIAPAWRPSLPVHHDHLQSSRTSPAQQEVADVVAVGPRDTVVRPRALGVAAPWGSSVRPDLPAPARQLRRDPPPPAGFRRGVNRHHGSFSSRNG